MSAARKDCCNPVWNGVGVSVAARWGPSSTSPRPGEWQGGGEPGRAEKGPTSLICGALLCGLRERDSPCNGTRAGLPGLPGLGERENLNAEAPATLEGIATIAGVAGAAIDEGRAGHANGRGPALELALGAPAGPEAATCHTAMARPRQSCQALQRPGRLGCAHECGSQ